jgi:ATP-binding cassette subfamily B protein
MRAEVITLGVGRSEVPQLLRHLSDERVREAAPPLTPADDDIVRMAARQGLVARAVTMRPHELARQLRLAAPMLIKLDSECYLLLLRVRRGQAHIARLGERPVTLPIQSIVDQLRRGPRASSSAPGTHDDGAWSAIPRHVRELLDRERARYGLQQAGWILEPGDNTARQSGAWFEGRLMVQVFGAALCHLAQFAAWVAAWIVLARIIFAPALAADWITVWLLCLLAALVFDAASRWLSGIAALSLGTRIKQRLLSALLRIPAQHGQIVELGRSVATTIDANRLDSQVANAGITAGLALLELILLIPLMIAAGAVPLTILLGLLLVALVSGSARYFVLHRHWHGASVDLTATHTEEMIGQRARKTLLGLSAWYDAEDRLLTRYHRTAAAADRLYLALRLTPRLWLLIGSAVTLLASQLVPAYPDTRLMASIGLLLLTTTVLQRLERGLKDGVGALVTIDHLRRELRQWSGEERARRTPDTDAEFPDVNAATLSAKAIHYQYPNTAAPILAGIDFELESGARVMLQGSSGSGKSTLGRILAGRLAPGSGSIIHGGLDANVLGPDAWKRRVCYVPQNHLNHVLTETLLFNLLLGRGWPPTPQAMARVHEVIDAAGLTALVERMPAGLQQMVGEGGWRLSQGEQARLFLARGLLQGSNVLVVDEPLAALDAQTAMDVLTTLQRTDGTLVMISHR